MNLLYRPGLLMFAAVLLWSASAGADGRASSANPNAYPDPKPPQEDRSSKPASGTAHGPAVEAGGPAPEMAQYYRDAAALYIQAAARCPPRAACYRRNADYHYCLARSLSGGGDCAKPTCSMTEPACDTPGGAQSAPATAGGRSQSLSGAIQQSFSKLASVLGSIEADRAQREAIARDAEMRQDAKAHGYLPKWEYYAAEQQAMERDPVFQNDFLLSAERHACPQECIGGNVNRMVSYLRNARKNAIGSLMQGRVLQEEAHEAMLMEAQIDAFHHFIARRAQEKAEHQARSAALLGQTTRVTTTPTVLPEHLSGPRLLKTSGRPLWLSYVAERGELADLTVLENGAARVLIQGHKIDDAAEDADAVYWSESGSIMRAVSGAGAPAPIAIDRRCATFLAVDEHDLFFTCITNPQKGAGAIFRVAKAGGTAAQLTPVSGGIGQPNLGATDMSWFVNATMESGWEDGALMMVPKSGGTPVALVESLQAGGVLVESSGARYYSVRPARRIEMTYDVYESKPGAAPRALLTYLDFATTLELSGGYLYWSETPFDAAQNPLPSSLKRMSLADGQVTLLADGIRGGVSFTVDGNTLYYAELGSSTWTNGGMTRKADGVLWLLDLPAPAISATASASPSQAGETPARGKRHRSKP